MYFPKCETVSLNSELTKLQLEYLHLRICCALTASVNMIVDTENGSDKVNSWSHRRTVPLHQR